MAAETSLPGSDKEADAARRWTGGAPVRFVADLSVVSGWDQAKG